MLRPSSFDPRPKVKKRRNPLPPNPEESSDDRAVKLGHFPTWLHRKLPTGHTLKKTALMINRSQLNTVCEEAKCPNLLECWSKQTATFLIMGKECTRYCGFCDIAHSKTPAPLNEEEPERIAQAVYQLKLKHVVITMVARDDLPDGGAAHLVAVIVAIRKRNPDTTVETLTSDFAGNTHSWDIVLAAKPEVFNYNIETVRSLTPIVRHKATYERTLELLSYVKSRQASAKTKIKSGMMVGLGETEEQVQETITNLAHAGCDIVTIGQYLQASPKKLRVKAFIHPKTFLNYEKFGYTQGIKQMYCGPLVRSSYNARLLKETS